MRESLRRIWHALHRRQFEADLSEELEFHRAMHQRDLEADGLPPDEVTVRTSRVMGPVLLASDQARDVWIAPWLRDAWQDLRLALRMLARDRRFTVAAVLALGLGIGATNTVFTLVNALLIRDLPFDRPDQLVGVQMRNEQKPRPTNLTYEDLREWRDTSTTFAALGASTHGAGVIVSGDAAPASRYRGQYVTANLFRLLLTEPILGRQFLPEEERPGAPAVVMLGHAMWQARYGGDTQVVGRIIRVDDTPATIIGVMPAGFAYSFTSELWQPLAQWPDLAASRRGGPGLETVGRLADSSDLIAARAEADAIAARIAAAAPATHKGMRGSIEPLNQGPMRSGLPILMTLMGAVGFVLLVACANVANLLLARAAQRAREMAVRASLGATRWRLVRQLLIECLLLATLAGTLGALLSIQGVRFLGTAFNTMEIAAPADAVKPYWVNLSMNGPVLLFLTVVILLTTLLFGLAPAWHVSKTNTNALLKEDGRGSAGSRRARRLTSAFMIAEIALTLVLLTGAGLLARSFFTLYYADYVLPQPSRLLVARLALPTQKYAAGDARARFYAALDDRLAARAGAAPAMITTEVPLDAFGTTMRTLAIEGRAIDAPAVEARAPGGGAGSARSAGATDQKVALVSIGARFFDTLGLRMTRGRALTDADARRGQEGIVVNERFASLFFPDGQVIGQRIRLSSATTNAGGGAGGAAVSPAPVSPAASSPDAARREASGGARAAVQHAAQEDPWLTIVGVAPNLPRTGPRRDPDPMVYAPLRLDSAPPAIVALLARADGDSRQGLTTAIAALREDVRALDPDVPLYSIEPLSAVIARGRMSQTLIGGFLAGLAGIALVLAAVGLYALTAHGVAQRTQEIGIRMALGARAPQVVWLFARRTLAHLAVGLTLGLGGALAIGKLLQSFLVHTAPRDPLTLAVVSALLILVALAAAWYPARRAARLDPMAALRDD